MIYIQEFKRKLSSQSSEAATVYQAAKQKLQTLPSKQAPRKATDCTDSPEEDDEDSAEITATEIQ